ncbi:MAG: DUF3788 domain-containing protein [Bacillota bacterium]|nr:DUF3788 domain-containing protein [Bacillota bacterium]
MTWSERYKQAEKPAMEQIEEYIGSPLWRELGVFVETTYEVRPQVEYSLCSGARGWNVKYKKSSRALCTLYPNTGFFTCLICIGVKEANEAELVLTGCCAYTRELYMKTQAFNGTRWLMIDVTSREILEDVKRLLWVRVKQKCRQEKR